MTAADVLLDEELADVLGDARRRRHGGRRSRSLVPLVPAALPTGVDRSSDRWRRLRGAIGDTNARGIDPDVVADLVWSTLERLAR